jgi:hypothetical protein
MAATISSSVMSDYSPISASRIFPCFSNGEVLPPLGLAATLPVEVQVLSNRPSMSMLYHTVGLNT